MGRGGYVFPDQWGYAFTLAFWLGGAVVFGLSARRVTSFPILLLLAVAFVASTVYIVRSLVPLLGWELLFEFP